MSASNPLRDDEKLMAGLGYWLSLFLSFIPALIFYFIKKDESAFIKKHALQSLFFNLIFWGLNIALWIVSALIGAVTFGVGSLLIMLLQVPLWIGMWVYMVILGIQVYQGQDKDIPLISKMLPQ